MSRSAPHANWKVKEEVPNSSCISDSCADCSPNTGAAQMQGSIEEVLSCASKDKMRAGREKEIEMNQKGCDAQRYARYLWC